MSTAKTLMEEINQGRIIARIDLARQPQRESSIRVALDSSLENLTAHQRAALKKKAARLAASRIVKDLLAHSLKDLSPKAAAYLYTITFQATLGGDFGRYFEPLDLGGKTKSDHSSALTLLTEAGLVERINRNFLFGRPSYLYRPAVAPQAIKQILTSEFAHLVETQIAGPTI